MGTPEQVQFLGDSGESLGAVAPHSPPQPGCLVVHGHSAGDTEVTQVEACPRGDGESPVCSPSTGHGPGRGQQEGVAGRSPRDVSEGASLPHPRAPHPRLPPRLSPCNLHETVSGSCSVPSGRAVCFLTKLPTSWLQPLTWAALGVRSPGPGLVSLL